jgi:hypothetical protein
MENSIRMDFKEICVKRVDWSDLAQDKEKWQYTPRFHKMQGIS